MVTRLMMREFDVVIEQDEEGNYVASVPALPGCHTQARSLDELLARVKEAIELCLEVDNHEPPPSFRFLGVQRLTVDDDLVEEARRLTGITTKRALVEEALKVLIASRSRRSLLDLKGKISFAEGYDYHSLREDRP
jgi:predicted RNase H-like HicB family nuclease